MKCLGHNHVNMSRIGTFAVALAVCLSCGAEQQDWPVRFRAYGEMLGRARAMPFLGIYADPGDPVPKSNAGMMLMGDHAPEANVLFAKLYSVDIDVRANLDSAFSTGLKAGLALPEEKLSRPVWAEHWDEITDTVSSIYAGRQLTQYTKQFVEEHVNGEDWETAAAVAKILIAASIHSKHDKQYSLQLLEGAQKRAASREERIYWSDLSGILSDLEDREPPPPQENVGTASRFVHAEYRGPGNLEARLSEYAHAVGVVHEKVGLLDVLEIPDSRSAFDPFRVMVIVQNALDPEGIILHAHSIATDDYDRFRERFSDAYSIGAKSAADAPELVEIDDAALLELREEAWHRLRSVEWDGMMDAAAKQFVERILRASDWKHRAIAGRFLLRATAGSTEGKAYALSMARRALTRATADSERAFWTELIALLELISPNNGLPSLD